MRIALSDDPWPLGQRTTGASNAARVHLDPDEVGPGVCAPCEPHGDEHGPELDGWHLVIRQRARRGTDVDGVELYGWHDVWEGDARVTSSNRGLALNRGRTETSDAAGQTFETVTALLPGAMELDVTATAVAWDNLGQRWEITAVEPMPSGTRLDLERVTDDAT